MNCPICNYPKLTNLSHHLTTVNGINGQERKALLLTVHGINGPERKALLLRACFSVFSRQTDHPQPSIPEAIYTLTQSGNSFLKTSLTEQRKLPNLTSDQTEDNLIPCPYDSRISYERIWGNSNPVMDYDIFKLHHPFSMLVPGP